GGSRLLSSLTSFAPWFRPGADDPRCSNHSPYPARASIARTRRRDDAFAVARQGVALCLAPSDPYAQQRAVMSEIHPRPVRVLKFGGSSVADADRIRHVVDIVRGEMASAPHVHFVVVVSAL